MAESTKNHDGADGYVKQPAQRSLHRVIVIETDDPATLISVIRELCGTNVIATNPRKLRKTSEPSAAVATLDTVTSNGADYITFADLFGDLWTAVKPWWPRILAGIAALVSVLVKNAS